VVAAWGGVVKVAADQHVTFLSVALQLVSCPRPDGDGLGGPLVQGVQAKAGAYGLIAGVELRMLGVIGRQLPAGARPDDLVFPGPGGSNGIPRGARTPLSTHNLRRVYQAAVAAAGEDLAHLDLRGPTTYATPSPPG
jgi:hypothetical protein